jgi:regulator of sirC expression with transglutaminase-like and TPR domain
VDATGWFAEVVAQPVVRLDEAALAIAAHGSTGLDVDLVLARLDDLGARVAEPRRDELCRVLFGEVGLRGNDADYYDPENSFLDRVLQRGVGIPITLAVVMIEVGRRAGVTIVGINSPSHFLVRDETDGVLLDPFNRGAEVDHIDAPVADTLTIVARMLNNLRGIYINRGDIGSLLWVLRLRTLLPGAGPEATYELTRAQARLN